MYAWKEEWKRPAKMWGWVVGDEFAPCAIGR